jgi:hypothetical protein
MMVRMSRILTPSSSRFCNTRCNAQRQLLGHQVFHQLGRFACQMIEQGLGFLTAQQFGGMRKDHVVEMGSHHGAGVDHGVAEHMRLLAQTCFDPDGRQAEGRVLGRTCRAR